MYIYNFQLMKKGRIVLAVAILWSLFNLFVLRYQAFYSFVSWVVGILFWAGLIAFLVYHANTILDNGIIWELVFRRKFRSAMREAKLCDNNIHPKYDRLSGKPDYSFFRFRLKPMLTQNVYEYQEQASVIAKILGVPHVAFTPDEDARYINATSSKAVAKKSGPSDTDEITEQLSFVEIGIRTDNEQLFEIPLFGTHILIAGKSGSGKGSFIWSVILGIRKFIRLGFVELYGADPKRLELGLGERLFHDYADDDEGIVEMLEKIVIDMKQRGLELKGKTRKVKISKEYPLCIVIIDELMYLAKLLPDTKLRARANKAIMTILVMGRAVGYLVIGAVQDPRKDVIDFRDLFQTKIALWLDKEMVDLILGNGMWEKGAHCEEIPPPNERNPGISGAGIGYSILENEVIPTRIRAHWQSDDAIKTAANY